MKRYLPWALAAAMLAMAQQATQKKESSEEKKEPAPLFDGKLGVKSSKQGKSSTTLGFNGIDPSGKVDQKMLAATPGAADQEKVKKMSTDRPTTTDLNAFLKEGELNSK